MEFKFERSVEDIRTVFADREYWFIRTFTGATYTDFVENGYVGIGFNNVPYSLLQATANSGVSEYKKLRDYISNNTNEQGAQATKWTNQLIDFQHEIKIGDIIIIPSENSDMLSIGQVEGNVTVVNDNRTFRFKDHYESYPEKRRSVKWLREIRRKDFQGDLGNMFFTRQAITRVNDFAELLESQISSLFKMNDRTHLIIQINQDEDINAFHLQSFLSGLTYFYTEYCKFLGEPENDQLFIKIKVQSKGRLALAGISGVGLLGLATIFALSDNPQIKLDLGEHGKIEAEGDGFLQSWSRFLNEDQERQQRMILFQDSMQQVQAKRNLNLITDDESGDDAENQGEES